MNIELITTDDLEQFKRELLKEIRIMVDSSKISERAKTWLKGKEVRELLGISIGTLQNLRTNGALPFRKIGGLLYYKYEDILRLMDSKTSTD
ncbi:MAG: helix-turn-helix domain-containing protein [Flavobacterium sp.]